MAKKTVKNNRRAKAKYPALNPSLNLKTRAILVDYDYVDKLSDSEKEWLNKFTNEYVHASLDTKKLKKNLHNTQKLKKDCFDRNNARNRDIYTREMAQGKMFSTEDLDYSEEEMHDILLDQVSSKQEAGESDENA